MVDMLTFRSLKVKASLDERFQTIEESRKALQAQQRQSQQELQILRARVLELDSERNRLAQENVSVRRAI